jgi:aspartate-semialdehyde dehydrogenase
MTCLTIELDRRVSPDEATHVFREWRGDPCVRGLPSAPERAVEVADSADRPQSRRDVDRGNGMTVTVGRVRGDSLFDLRLVALGHNTIRGAAGCSVLNAEVLATQGAFGAS